MSAKSRTNAFTNEEFTDLLSGAQAWRMLYLPAEICSCRQRNNGSPRADCPTCLGYGYTWTAPAVQTWTERFYYGSETRPAKPAFHHLTTADLQRVWDENNTEYPDAFINDAGIVEFPGENPGVGSEFFIQYQAPFAIKGLITGLQTNREVGETGIWEHRQGNLTIAHKTEAPDGSWVASPAYEADENDRFVVLDARQRFQQVLYREDNPNLERLLYTYVWSISACYRNEPSGGRTVYTEGTDFALDQGRVSWSPGRGPKPGQSYAVRYEACPEFYLFRSNDLTRHQGGELLPKRFTVRAWQLWPQANGVTR